MEDTPSLSAGSVQDRLKIAILVRRFVTTGGAERYAVEVARRLALKHNVHVFAQEWAWNGREKIVFHRIPKFFERPSLLNLILFSYFTRKNLDESFDIIHSHERVTHFDALTIHCPCFRTFITQEKRWWKKIGIWISVAISPRKLTYLRLEKKQFCFHNQRMLIAVSENVKKNVQASYALPEDYFGLAYPGVDVQFGNKNDAAKNRETTRAKLGIGQNDLVILFVGTEFKRKGLDSLLRGFALVVRSGIKLVIAGGGNPDNYVILSKKLGIEDHVLFLGLVEDIEIIYAMSDIYILPTLSDPAAMTPIEAMASGLATVMSCSKYNGSAEHISQNEAIILENPENPNEIADSLSLLMDKAFRTELSQRGRQLAKKLTWEKTTEDTVAVYQRILQLKKE